MVKIAISTLSADPLSWLNRIPIRILPCLFICSPVGAGYSGALFLEENECQTFPRYW